MARPDTWFRMYNSTLDNPKAQRLSGDLFKTWINLLCLASKRNGRLPGDEDIGFALRIPTAKVQPILVKLIAAGLIDADGDDLVPHDWNDLQFKSDVSTQRVKAFRQRHMKRDETVSRNVSETAQEKNRPDQKHPSDVLATKPKRRSQIPPDWQPNDKDFAHATDRNLAPDTVRNLVEPFRDHHIAKQTLSADFSANWRTWVKNHIHYNGTGPWPRDGGSRPGSNVRERQSAVTARDRILAKAGIQREGDNPLRPDNGDSQGGFDRSGEAGYGRIIEADDWQRVPESADGNEGDDTSGTGDDGRSGGAVRGLSETLDGLPRGRGSVRVEDASRPEPLVARVVGAERAAGDSHLPATDDADGLAASAFLKRSA